jgi:hypothetical protein
MTENTCLQEKRELVDTDLVLTDIMDDWIVSDVYNFTYFFVFKDRGSDSASPAVNSFESVQFALTIFCRQLTLHPNRSKQKPRQKYPLLNLQHQRQQNFPLQRLIL